MTGVIFGIVCRCSAYGDAVAIPGAFKTYEEAEAEVKLLLEADGIVGMQWSQYEIKKKYIYCKDSK